MTKVISDNKLSRADGRSFVADIALRLYEKLDTPTSLMCYIVLNEGDFEQLYDLSVDPNNYIDADRFQKDYQAVSYIKKCILNDSDARSELALKKFLEAERECLATNLLLRDRIRESNLSGIFHTAARVVSGILGVVPDLATHTFRFGPGATSAVNGLEVSIPGKFNKGSLQCTRDAIPLVERMFLHNPLLYAAKTGLYIEGPASVIKPTFNMINYNTLTFVPKNGKVDRCICIEPDMNVPLQLMAGSYIRQRLLKDGVDLSKQQDVNARIAKIGSQDGSYATIDLSSASDTIAIALVAELLPFGWFELLSNLRSPFTRYKDCNGEDTYIENEKFSSMGNGFTFELETLLFLALARACAFHLECDAKDVYVYGDDIVVPTRVAHVLLDVLKVAGFKPNEEKTFITGPFRESCGQDFFLGKAVRPVFLKEIPKHEVDKFKVANSIRSIAHHSYGGIGLCDRRFRPLWERIVNSIPRHWRLFGPSELGDSVINACYGEKNYATNLYGITYVRGAVFRPRRGSLSSYDDGVQRASGIYGCSQTYPLRGRGHYGTTKYTVRFWDAYDFRWC